MKILLVFIPILALFLICTMKTAGISVDEDTGTITGNLVYIDSLPVSNASVNLYYKKSSDADRNTAWSLVGRKKSNSAGNFSFNTLSNGEYIVEAIGDFAGSLDTTRISHADSSHVRLTVRALGIIEGTIDSAVMDRYSSLTVIIPEINRIVTVDTGISFQFRNLAPFTYTVCLMTNDTVLTAPGCARTVTVEPWATSHIDRLGASDIVGEIQKPQAPDGLRVRQIEEQSITLEWNVVANSNTYLLFRSNGESDSFDTIYKSSNTVITDIAVKPGKSYMYFVRAVNSTGVSEKSTALIAALPEVQQSNKLPAILIFTPAYNSVYITTDSIRFSVSATDFDGTISSIHISIDNIPSGSSVVSPYSGAIAPLQKGKHVFKVTAVDAAGDSIISAPIQLIVDDILCGDVNTDGVVDDNDALDVTRYTVGLKPSRFNEMAADVDRDGKISATDALLIAQYYNGIIDLLPCYGTW